jgi:hypothetical protein
MFRVVHVPVDNRPRRRAFAGAHVRFGQFLDNMSILRAFWLETATLSARQQEGTVRSRRNGHRHSDVQNQA